MKSKLQEYCEAIQNRTMTPLEEKWANNSNKRFEANLKDMDPRLFDFYQKLVIEYMTNKD